MNERAASDDDDVLLLDGGGSAACWLCSGGRRSTLRESNRRCCCCFGDGLGPSLDARASSCHRPTNRCDDGPPRRCCSTTVDSDTTITTTSGERTAAAAESSEDGAGGEHEQLGGGGGSCLSRAAIEAWEAAETWASAVAAATGAVAGGGNGASVQTPEGTFAGSTDKETARRGGRKSTPMKPERRCSCRTVDEGRPERRQSNARRRCCSLAGSAAGVCQGAVHRWDSVLLPCGSSSTAAPRGFCPCAVHRRDSVLRGGGGCGGGRQTNAAHSFGGGGGDVYPAHASPPQRTTTWDESDRRKGRPSLDAVAACPPVVVGAAAAIVLGRIERGGRLWSERAWRAGLAALKAHRTRAGLRGARHATAVSHCDIVLKGRGLRGLGARVRRKRDRRKTPFAAAAAAAARVAETYARAQQMQRVVTMLKRNWQARMALRSRDDLADLHFAEWRVPNAVQEWRQRARASSNLALHARTRSPLPFACGGRHTESSRLKRLCRDSQNIATSKWRSRALPAALARWVGHSLGDKEKRRRLLAWRDALSAPPPPPLATSSVSGNHDGSRAGGAGRQQGEASVRRELPETEEAEPDDNDDSEGSGLAPTVLPREPAAGPGPLSAVVPVDAAAGKTVTQRSSGGGERTPPLEKAGGWEEGAEGSVVGSTEASKPGGEERQDVNERVEGTVGTQGVDEKPPTARPLLACRSVPATGVVRVGPICLEEWWTIDAAASMDWAVPARNRGGVEAFGVRLDGEGKKRRSGSPEEIAGGFGDTASAGESNGGRGRCSTAGGSSGPSDRGGGKRGGGTRRGNETAALMGAASCDGGVEVLKLDGRVSRATSQASTSAGAVGQAISAESNGGSNGPESGKSCSYSDDWEGDEEEGKLGHSISGEPREASSTLATAERAETAVPKPPPVPATSAGVSGTPGGRDRTATACPQEAGSGTIAPASELTSPEKKPTACSSDLKDGDLRQEEDDVGSVPYGPGAMVLLDHISPRAIGGSAQVAVEDGRSQRSCDESLSASVGGVCLSGEPAAATGSGSSFATPLVAAGPPARGSTVAIRADELSDDDVSVSAGGSDNRRPATSEDSTATGSGARTGDGGDVNVSPAVSWVSELGAEDLRFNQRRDLGRTLSGGWMPAAGPGASSLRGVRRSDVRDAVGASSAPCLGDLCSPEIPAASLGVPAARLRPAGGAGSSRPRFAEEIVAAQQPPLGAVQREEGVDDGAGGRVPPSSPDSVPRGAGGSAIRRDVLGGTVTVWPPLGSTCDVLRDEERRLSVSQPQRQEGAGEGEGDGDEQHQHHHQQEQQQQQQRMMSYGGSVTSEHPPRRERSENSLRPASAPRERQSPPVDHRQTDDSNLLSSFGDNGTGLVVVGNGCGRQESTIPAPLRVSARGTAEERGSRYERLVGDRSGVPGDDGGEAGRGDAGSHEGVVLAFPTPERAPSSELSCISWSDRVDDETADGTPQEPPRSTNDLRSGDEAGAVGTRPEEYGDGLSFSYAGSRRRSRGGSGGGGESSEGTGAERASGIARITGLKTNTRLDVPAVGEMGPPADACSAAAGEARSKLQASEAGEGVGGGAGSGGSGSAVGSSGTRRRSHVINSSGSVDSRSSKSSRSRRTICGGDGNGGGSGGNSINSRSATNIGRGSRGDSCVIGGGGINSRTGTSSGDVGGGGGGSVSSKRTTSSREDSGSRSGGGGGSSVMRAISSGGAGGSGDSVSRSRSKASSGGIRGASSVSGGSGINSRTGASSGGFGGGGDSVSTKKTTNTGGCSGGDSVSGGGDSSSRRVISSKGVGGGGDSASPRSTTNAGGRSGSGGGGTCTSVGRARSSGDGGGGSGDGSGSRRTTSSCGDKCSGSGGGDGGSSIRKAMASGDGGGGRGNSSNSSSSSSSSSSRTASSGDDKESGSGSGGGGGSSVMRARSNGDGRGDSRSISSTSTSTSRRTTSSGGGNVSGGGGSSVGGAKSSSGGGGGGGNSGSSVRRTISSSGDEVSVRDGGGSSMRRAISNGDGRGGGGGIGSKRTTSSSGDQGSGSRSGSGGGRSVMGAISSGDVGGGGESGSSRRTSSSGGGSGGGSSSERCRGSVVQTSVSSSACPDLRRPGRRGRLEERLSEAFLWHHLLHTGLRIWRTRAAATSAFRRRCAPSLASAALVFSKRTALAAWRAAHARLLSRNTAAAATAARLARQSSLLLRRECRLRRVTSGGGGGGGGGAGPGKPSVALAIVAVRRWHRRSDASLLLRRTFWAWRARARDSREVGRHRRRALERRGLAAWCRAAREAGRARGCATAVAFFMSRAVAGRRLRAWVERRRRRLEATRAAEDHRARAAVNPGAARWRRQRRRDQQLRMEAAWSSWRETTRGRKMSRSARRAVVEAVESRLRSSAIGAWRDFVDGRLARRGLLAEAAQSRARRLKRKGLRGVKGGALDARAPRDAVWVGDEHWRRRRAAIVVARLRNLAESRRRMVRRAAALCLRVAARAGLTRWRQSARDWRVAREACVKGEAWRRDKARRDGVSVLSGRLGRRAKHDRAIRVSTLHLSRRLAGRAVAVWRGWTRRRAAAADLYEGASALHRSWILSAGLRALDRVARARTSRREAIVVAERHLLRFYGLGRWRAAAASRRRARSRAEIATVHWARTLSSKVLISWEAASLQQWAETRQEEAAARHERLASKRRALRAWMTRVRSRRRCLLCVGSRGVGVSLAEERAGSEGGLLSSNGIYSR
ncbi:unnamed protein product [Ectocarpus sp. CCAP 1310/34]|nr:unnamed protein product [Ectocarpus sp. CCAP 1310/34]